ncbi:MAG: serpin family protein [Lachnospiraceae bacterium]|nr:serpin family protein [Lachnospiraceae bacterium]
MNKEELFETLSDIDEKNVKNAREYKHSKFSKFQRFGALVAVAAVAIVAIAVTPLFNKNTEDPFGIKYPSSMKTVLASYPAPIGGGMTSEEFAETDEYWDSIIALRDRYDTTMGYPGKMASYYSAISGQLLTGDDENTVCSPLNTYIALTMLAELSDGNTRQQILDLLGAKDLTELRRDVKSIWESNYVNAPYLKSLLANSVWLNKEYSFNEATLKSLAENYYASSFVGTPGSEDMDKALRDWTNANTGNLLTEFTKDMSLDPSTVLELVSTIYFKATWEDKFYESQNTEETFHGTKGDTTATMMHQSGVMNFYETEKFTAIGLDLFGSGTMYFYLPKDGVDVNALASDPDVLTITRDSEYASAGMPTVNISLPKFKVSQKTDLLPVLAALGVTDALDPELADFSPVTTTGTDLFVNKANHAALVEVDEEGVTGAAYTEIAMVEGCMISTDEVDFTLDRPFMFVVTGGDESVLFTGMVKNVE